MQHIVINFHHIEEYTTTLEKFHTKSKRSGTDYNPEFIGGVIESDGCHYKHNYVDIFFTPWAVGAPCQCADPNGRLWQSKIENNVFDTLAEDYYCEPFVDSVLQRLQMFFFGFNPPVLCPPIPFPYNVWQLNGSPSISVRCHLIDLSPFVEYDINRAPLLQCIDACLRNGWLSGNLPQIPNEPDITNNNTYYQVGNCKTFYNTNKFD